MHSPSKLADWLTLLRISNTPTVVSAVCCGWILSSPFDTPSLRLPFALTCIGLVAMYCAGMILNDTCDISIDKLERPDRPLPSQRIQPRTALVTAITTLLIGTILCTLAGYLCQRTIPALTISVGLATAIVLYDLLHSRLAAIGLMLMSSCRLLGILLPATIAGWHFQHSEPSTYLAPLAATTAALWTLGLSLVARHETTHKAPSRLPVYLLATLPLAHLVALDQILPNGIVNTTLAFTLTIITMLLTHSAGRLIRTGHTPQGIMRWIAMLAMLDAITLSALQHTNYAIIALACAMLCRLLQRNTAGS